MFCTEPILIVSSLKPGFSTFNLQASALEWAFATTTIYHTVTASLPNGAFSSAVSEVIWGMMPL